MGINHLFLLAVTAPALALIFTSGEVSLAAESRDSSQSFDPAKGFKPAQRDLTEIFLQLAGSLEFYGSPEPYLRHMQKEHARIEGLYQRKHGKVLRSYRPAYMTEEYLNRLTRNWKTLAPDLNLEPFTKEVGEDMREAIKGTRGTGTIIVEIFNEHQARVFDEMAGEGKGRADFDTLKAQLISNLELDKKVVDEGKYEVARRDAVSYAIIIHGITMKLFKRVEQGLEPADAERVKTVLSSFFLDVGKTAQSELEVGIAEWAIDSSLTAAK